MKSLLLIVGIVLIIACVLSLLYAALNLLGYSRMLDGSALQYAKMHRRMIVFLVVGIILAIIGAACIVIRTKI